MMLTMPTMTEPRGAAHRREIDFQLLQSMRPRLALLAEDDDEMRRFLASWLRDLGFEVREAADGRQLRDLIIECLIDQEVPSLVLTDVRMPEQSGIDILRGFVDDPVRIPFVMLTGFATDEVRRECERLGAVAVVPKPFELRKLHAVVLQATADPSGPEPGRR